MGGFRKALLVVKMLNNPTASKNYSADRGLLDITYLYIAVITSADGHELLLYIRPAVTRREG